VAAAALVGVVAYFSLRASPNLSDIAWLPRGITRWLDSPAGSNIRTGIPFLFLGLISFLVRPGSLLSRIFIPVLFLLPLAVELAQFFLPRRCPDVRDVLWAWAGGSLGILIASLLHPAKPKQGSKNQEL